MGLSRRQIELVQGVFALVGITLGGVSLVRWFIDGEHNGPFRLIFGSPTGTWGYLAPALVLLGAIVLIAALEPARRRRK